MIQVLLEENGIDIRKWRNDVGYFELSIGDSQKRPVVFVVLNSKDVYTDIVKMVEFVKNHYQFENE